MALLIYAPVAFALLYNQLFVHAVLGGVLLVGLTQVPNWDMWASYTKHRGLTHTFAFAAGVGVFTGFVLAVTSYLSADVATTHLDHPTIALNPLVMGAFGFLMGALSIAAHMLADVITPPGIQPLLPFRETRKYYQLSTSASPVSNTVLFASGVGATVVACLIGVYLSGLTLETVMEIVQELPLPMED